MEGDQKSRCCRKSNLRIAVVLLGGFVIHLALGSLYTFGNFAPYIISYLRNRTDDTEIRNVDSLWIQASGSVGNCLGLVVGGVIAHRFGARVATFLGSIVFCGSVAANYFSVNQSFIALVFSYGLTRYFGHKLVYGAPVQTAIKWLPNHSTLAAGLIVSGTGGGSLIFNQVITGYINPDNLSPDLITDDGDRYFTQPELLDRVPTCFLILGAIYFGMQLIGIACLSEPPPALTDVTIDTEKNFEREVIKNNFVEEKTLEGDGVTTDTSSHFKENGSADIHENVGLKHTEDDIDQETGHENKGFKYTEDIDQETGHENKEFKHKEDTGFDIEEILNIQVKKDDIAVYNYDALHNIQDTDKKPSSELDGNDAENEMPKETSGPTEFGIFEAIKFALRCRSFYIVWFTMMCINGGMQFINSLYKAYGQTFIEDDHFLALVGSLGAIFNCIGRPIWGAVMDKTSFRVAIRCVSVGFVICTATLLVTEYLPKYLFLVWICALYFFFCGIWSIMPSTLAKLLGAQHMAINYGIIFTGLSVVNILGSLFGTALKTEIGWHGLFFMASGLGALVFLLSFFFNGVDRNGKRI